MFHEFLDDLNCFMGIVINDAGNINFNEYKYSSTIQFSSFIEEQNITGKHFTIDRSNRQLIAAKNTEILFFQYKCRNDYFLHSNGICIKCPLGSILNGKCYAKLKLVEIV
jgi:hypothetical protein